MKNRLTRLAFKAILGIGLFFNPVFGSPNEKQLFLKQNPEIREYVRFFAQTSIEREILILEAEKQTKYTMFSKLLEHGETLYGGVKDSVELLENIDRDFEVQKEYFEEIKEKMPAGAELFYVHIVVPAESKENLGYLALKDGKVVIDDTFNLLGETKMNLKNLKVSTAQEPEQPEPVGSGQPMSPARKSENHSHD